MLSIRVWSFLQQRNTETGAPGPRHCLSQQGQTPELSHWDSLDATWVWTWTQWIKLSLLLLLCRFSRAQLFMTPWTAAHQAPPSMGFSRREYWSEVPLPSLKAQPSTVIFVGWSKVQLLAIGVSLVLSQWCRDMLLRHRWDHWWEGEFYATWGSSLGLHGPAIAMSVSVCLAGSAVWLWVWFLGS